MQRDTNKIGSQTRLRTDRVRAVANQFASDASAPTITRTTRKFVAAANTRIAFGGHTFTMVGPYIQYFFPFSRADRLSGLYSRMRHIPPGRSSPAASRTTSRGLGT